jgi:hypothetical protein
MALYSSSFSFSPCLSVSPRPSPSLSPLISIVNKTPQFWACCSCCCSFLLSSAALHYIFVANENKKNTAKILVEVYWKTEEKTLCKKIKKNIRAQQLRSSEEKKREKLCLRSTFVSFAETEEKRVRLVVTSMFFFANLEGLAKFSYNQNM